MTHKIKPLSSQVVAKTKQPQTKTKSGLYLPESSTEKSVTVEVIAVGPEVKTIKPGNQIIHKQYEATELTIDKQDYLIIKEEAILAILEGDK